MTTRRTFTVEFWEERGGKFEILAKSPAGARRIARNLVQFRNFDENAIDWLHGASGVISVKEGGEA
jgi:hypothetical protein